jgi:hypothetical protein
MLLNHVPQMSSLQGLKDADIAATPPGHHPRPAGGPGPNDPVCARVYV